MGGDDNRHRDGHRAGGTGYLRPRAPEYRGEETDGDRTVYAGDRPQAGGYAEGQRHRQAHHCRRDAAKDIPAQGLDVVFQVSAPSMNSSSIHYGVSIPRSPRGQVSVQI